MQARINSYLVTSNGAKIVTIFGYSTRGLPSLEVHGIGKLGKGMKEKMIYLTRTRELQLPRRRYVICLDIDELTGDERWFELKSLEFPILLLYWFLGGIIPVSRLDDCITQGRVNARGEIFQSTLEQELKEELSAGALTLDPLDLKAIVAKHTSEHFLPQIDTEELLMNVPGMKCYLDG